MFKTKRSIWTFLLSSLMLLLMAGTAFAGEANILLPDLSKITFFGGSLGGVTILNFGLLICLIGLAFGFMQYAQTKNLPAHKSMLDVSQTIWETCKTYLLQQGKFLLALWVLIAICIVYYFGVLSAMGTSAVVIILLASVVGILGSYAVAWFGIRINTVANSRAAFASLSGNPLNIVNICLRSGMSVGLVLVSIELFVMLIILVYIPQHVAGACFIGFAIGESLGASVLRI
jgi:K(+)-stimulated pyrophosphate-energized sodium pump